MQQIPSVTSNFLQFGTWGLFFGIFCLVYLASRGVSQQYRCEIVGRTTPNFAADQDRLNVSLYQGGLKQDFICGESDNNAN